MWQIKTSFNIRMEKYQYVPSRSILRLEDTTETPSIIYPPPVPSLLYTFSILMALSILCYIFVIYHYLATSRSRSALNNHVIILLLIVYGVQTLFDTPLHLDYFRIGYYWPPNMVYCFSLYMLDYILYEIATLLMTWASIERHILIFNPSMLNTYRQRIIGHYIPLAFCFIYPTIYYTYFILFYPCDSYYDMSKLTCVAACFLWTNNTMAYYEIIMHGFVPVCLVAIFSTTLLIRVLWKRQQMGREMTWRKNRKMTIQLLAVSTTFLVFNIGYFVIVLIQMVRDPTFGADLMVWFLSINLCAPQLIFPFLCLGTMPNLRKKLRGLRPRRRGATIEPIDPQGSIRMRTNTVKAGTSVPRLTLGS